MLKKIHFELKRGSTISQKSTESQTIDEDDLPQVLNNNNNSSNQETMITNERTNPAVRWFYTLFYLCCCCFHKPRQYQSSSTQMPPKGSLNKSTTTKDLDSDSIGSYRTRNSNHDSEDMESFVGPSLVNTYLSEDSLTVPYTELLLRLRKARQNLINLTVAAVASPTARTSNSHSIRGSISTISQTGSLRPSDSANYNLLTNDTIADLDWCLEHLERIQEQRISENISRLNMPLDFRRLFGNNEPELSQDDSTTFTPRRLSEFGVETPHKSALGMQLALVDTWTIDIFLVDEWSLHRPLTCLMYTVFMRHELLTMLKIPVTTFLNYATVLEDKYVMANPFHNSLHAADVTQATNYYLSLPSFRPTFSALEVCCAIFAAAVHDVDHPGLTNQFLVNSCSELAIMYNDTSVLENHHLAVAFRLLQNKNCDIFRNIERKQRMALRRLIIAMVLSTDMSRHFKLVSKWRLVMERKESDSAELHFDSYIDRLVVLENLVHCADLSNPTRPLPLYKRWITLLMEEFYRQGDRERDAGQEISPMCDRFRSRVEKWQLTFIDTFVYPEFGAFAELVHPELAEVMEQLKSNRDYYVDNLPPEARPSLDLSLDDPST